MCVFLICISLRSSTSKVVFLHLFHDDQACCGRSWLMVQYPTADLYMGENLTTVCVSASKASPGRQPFTDSNRTSCKSCSCGLKSFKSQVVWNDEATGHENDSGICN
ncbi:hypothetical protein V8C34DRAFT_273247 [Trichoderma compactum]